MSASTTSLPAPSADQLHQWFHNDEDWHDDFQKQAHAIRASVNCHKLRLFAENLNEDGANRYLMGSYDRVWAWIENQRGGRFYYELIPSDQPCHFHCDIDFPLSSKRTSDVPEKVETFFFQVFQQELHAHFPSTASAPPEIVVKDASTADKFSRHYIMRVPGHAFAGNQDCGDFAAMLCEKYADTLCIANDDDDNEEDGAADSWCDMSIYTSNRIFRMMYCAKKRSPNRVFLPPPSNDDNNNNKNTRHQLDKTLWLKSLVLNVWTEGTTAPLQIMHFTEESDKQQQQKKQTSPPSKKRKKSTGGSGITARRLLPTACNAFLQQLTADILAQYPNVRASDLLGFHRPSGQQAPPRYLHLRTVSGACQKRKDAKMAPHAHDHIYFLVDVQHRCFTQCCWSRKAPCNKQHPRPGPWKSWDTQVIAAYIAQGARNEAFCSIFAQVQHSFAPCFSSSVSNELDKK